MDKHQELEELIARKEKLVKPLTEEQRAFVREMKKRLPYLEKRLKEPSTSSDTEPSSEEETQLG